MNRFLRANGKSGCYAISRSLGLACRTGRLSRTPGVLLRLLLLLLLLLLLPLLLLHLLTLGSLTA